VVRTGKQKVLAFAEFDEKPSGLGAVLSLGARPTRRKLAKPAIAARRNAVPPKHETTSELQTFRFIDLFAGIGGLRRGFQRIGGQCVFTCEWNAFARKTYEANFCDGPEHPFAGDITKVTEAEIPEHDVLIAGFPCQPFSIAGVSKKNALGRNHGFKCEAQGTLFFDVARLIEHHRPTAFLLENVKNLASHDKGNTFRVIYRTLTEELGYFVQWRVIDAKSFVPQHRERIFIVGFRDKTEFDFKSLALPDTTNGPKLESILHPEDGSEPADEQYTSGPLAKVLQRYTLTDHLWSYLQNYAEKHRQKGNGFGFGLNGPLDVARTLSARYYKDGSEILIRQSRRNPRRLTPRECSRLMGFDRAGETPFIIPVSDTQAYKQFGNSVVVPVVEAVANHMAPHLQSCLAPAIRRPAKTNGRHR
jgi:DNA (cytosine-5)-methyltransferase 1